MTFTELNLIKPLMQALDTQGYTNPTPIQEQAIPHILAGSDVFGKAQTGTGKTAAFTLPILQMIQNNKTESKRSIKALILAPTRELAIQISESVSSYGKHLRLSHTLVYGGVSQNRQVNDIRRGVDILIATPGRLLDLMQQGFISLNDVQYFVLDEADRMLDMGFIVDIKKIVAKLPAKKQTLFFSATSTTEIMKLANTILRNPVSVSVTPVTATEALIEQSVYFVTKENKRSLLKHVLSGKDVHNALVFTRTKRAADRVVKELNSSGVKADAIHGDKSQAAREKALRGFKNKHIRVLVATDIASRGIDVDKLSHVINYELPEQPETYVHRIGRTGRAGTPGVALSFCTRDERGYLKDIHRLIKKNIDVVTAHPFA